MSTINLLPDDYVKNRIRKRANFFCLILFAVVTAGVVGAAFVSEQSSRHTRKVCDEVNASYAEAAKLINQMHQLQEQKAILMVKAEQAAALQERVPRSYILGTLTNACPDRASLLSVRLDTRIADGDKPGTKFDTVAAARSGKAPPVMVDMVVTGQAGTDVDVARFITNLARNPLLSNVDLNYSEERTMNKDLIREFQVRMEVKPGLDVLDVLGKGPKASPAARPSPSPKALASTGGKP